MVAPAAIYVVLLSFICLFSTTKLINHEIEIFKRKISCRVIRLLVCGRS